MKTSIKKLLRNACFILLSAIYFQAKADTIPLHFVDTTNISYAFYENSDCSCMELLISDRILDRTLQVADSVFVNIYDDQNNLLFNSGTEITTLSGTLIPSNFFSSRSLTGIGSFQTSQNLSRFNFTCHPLNYPSITLEMFIKNSTPTVYKLQLAFGSIPTGVSESSTLVSNSNVVIYDLSGTQVYIGPLQGFYSQDFHGLFVVNPAEGKTYKIFKI